ncbi:MAG: DivIVA domain-containing protein [Firmicutes bacterium]|nr:DivIVA domain-containing protein [Bacillota bacterium]
MLTPLDIHNKEFRRGFRGYSETEVDEFLDEIVRDFEVLLKENAEYKQKIEDLEEKVAHFRLIEDTLNNTLVVAQRTAEEVKNNAHKEAEIIVRDAGAQADKIIEENQLRVRQIHAQYQDLKHEVEVFRARMRALLQSYLDIIDREEPLTEERAGE